MSMEHLSPKTWPSKKNHIMNHRDMYKDYKRKMWIKKKKTGDTRWRQRLTEKQHKEIITDLYLNIENYIIEKKRPVTLPLIGTFSIRRRKSMGGLVNDVDHANPKNQLRKLLGLAKKYFWSFYWDRKTGSLENAPYYKFRLHPHLKERDRGVGRLRDLK